MPPKPNRCLHSCTYKHTGSFNIILVYLPLVRYLVTKLHHSGLSADHAQAQGREVSETCEAAGGNSYVKFPCCNN